MMQPKRKKFATRDPSTLSCGRCCVCLYWIEAAILLDKRTATATAQSLSFCRGRSGVVVSSPVRSIRPHLDGFFWRTKAAAAKTTTLLVVGKGSKLWGEGTLDDRRILTDFRSTEYLVSSIYF